jgi:hypothetical protein
VAHDVIEASIAKTHDDLLRLVAGIEADYASIANGVLIRGKPVKEGLRFSGRNTGKKRARRDGERRNCFEGVEKFGIHLDDPMLSGKSAQLEC